MEKQENNKLSLKKNLLICVTGSIATVKLPLLVYFFKDYFNLKIIATKSSKHFLNRQEIDDVQKVEIFEDHMQTQQWTKMGDPVLHIELRKWADLILVAPLSANTMAKIANGLCDSLVTLVCRCWDFSKISQQIANQQNEPQKKVYSSDLKYPFIVCPAMNTMMFEHPCTGEHIKKIKSWGITVIDTQVKLLACGDRGLGAMASGELIAQTVKSIMNKRCVKAQKIKQ